jgi:hypothetical protein
MCVQHKIKTRSRNDRCRGKEISITPSECASVASVTQQAMRMHRIVLLSAACPAVPHFSTLSHTRRDCKKVIKHDSFTFSTTAISTISHSQKNSATYYHKCV